MRSARMRSARMRSARMRSARMSAMLKCPAGGRGAQFHA